MVVKTLINQNKLLIIFIKTKLYYNKFLFNIICLLGFNLEH